MAGVADQDQGPAARHIAVGLHVHLGDQRAGGVQHRQAARAASASTARETPWALKMVTAPSGTFVQRLDKPRALGLEPFHHMAVVDDLVAHIDGRAVELQRALDDVDRAHHACTEPPRLGQHHLQVELPAALDAPRAMA